MALKIKIEDVEISNREFIKGVEAMKPEDMFWIIDRLNKMDTFHKEVWHFKTAALKLSKRELESFEILDLLRECNNIQSALLKKLKAISKKT